MLEDPEALWSCELEVTAGQLLKRLAHVWMRALEWHLLQGLIQSISVQ